MLIIFDLDDTLVETSRCLLPFKQKWIIKKLFDAGLVSPLSQNQTLIEYQKLDACSLSSRQTIAAFLKKFEASLCFQEIAYTALNEALPDHLPLKPVQGAIPLLNRLKQAGHILALVTMGDPKLQKEKLKKAGIEPAFFSKISIVEPLKDPLNYLNKKAAYEETIKQFKVAAKEVLVCGDRIMYDLMPAKQLGLTTVHFCYGRGGNFNEPQIEVEQYVDHTIYTLPQLYHILK